MTEKQLPLFRIFDFELMFWINKHEDKLRFKVEKEEGRDNIEDIDFTEYFEVGKITKMDFWACGRRDYRDWTCKDRTGRINIENDDEVSVIEVTPTYVVLETNISGNASGSDGRVYYRYFGLDYHPGYIRENLERGSCANPPGCDNVTPRLVLQYQLRANKFSVDQNKGGIRTKEITINDGVQDIATTEYEYKNGITSYAPTKEQRGIPYASELPAPTVMYERVTMNNKDGEGNHLGSTTYEFETLEPSKEEPGYIYSLGEAFRVKENQDEERIEAGCNVKLNKFTIESKIANLGRIKSIKTFNKNHQLLSEKENSYKFDLESDGEIGVKQESHISYKRYQDLENDEYNYFVTSTSKVNYPSVLAKTKTTEGSFTVEQTFDKHDFLTGQLLESTTVASDGTKFRTRSVPAYTKYPQMGSMVDDATNKNMLSQEAASFTYLLDDNNEIDQVVGVGISTWNNNWNYRDYQGQTETPTEDSEKIWRKHKTFTWDGPLNSKGLLEGFDITNDDGFVWELGQPQTNDQWKQVSEVTQYDHYSKALESKDINNNYAASKMADSDSKVLAVSNAKYTEMYYSGAENRVVESNGDETDYFDGEVKSYGVVTNVTDAHTGNNIVRIGANENAFEVEIPANTERTDLKSKFKISVWTRKGGENRLKIKVNGNLQDFNQFENIEAGDWVMISGYLTIPTTETTVAITTTGTQIDLDDFRLHPVVSSMSSYVYNEWDELWFLIGSNGLASKYEYDEAGRLVKVYIEVAKNEKTTGGFQLVKDLSYSYKGTVEKDTNGNGVIDGNEKGF